MVMPKENPALYGSIVLRLVLWYYREMLVEKNMFGVALASARELHAVLGGRTDRPQVRQPLKTVLVLRMGALMLFTVAFCQGKYESKQSIER